MLFDEMICWDANQTELGTHYIRLQNILKLKSISMHGAKSRGILLDHSITHLVLKLCWQNIAYFWDL